MSEPLPHQSRPRVLPRFFMLLFCLLVGAFISTTFVTGFTRTAVVLVVVPLITMLICTHHRFRERGAIVIVAAATFVFLAIIHAMRRYYDPDCVLGPAVSAPMEMIVYSVLTIITVAAAGSLCVAFSSNGWRRRVRWPVFVIILLSLVALAVLAQQSIGNRSPVGILQTIAQIEEAGIQDAGMNQDLSCFLAMCGRETEAEAVPQWMIYEGSPDPPDPTQRLDISKFQALPWREAVQEIANREQLVIIMEQHNAPRHRQWIEQTLPVFHAAGFRDYAAETLLEPARALELRRYPIASTGNYSRDPSFGNLLRTAVKLGFRLHAYEYLSKTIEERESAQAANLAKLFAENPKLKLIVHAGPGHIKKMPDESGDRWMAAQLWEMTSIEPFCIWQTFHAPLAHESRQLAKLIGTGDEPVMLVPMPTELAGKHFLGIPEEAVDAIVVHSPSAGGPAERVHGFQSKRQRVSGIWHGTERPVLIGAFKIGESADAIALEQVMLRDNEREFTLWVPDELYELRVFGLQGRISTARSNRVPALEIKTE